MWIGLSLVSNVAVWHYRRLTKKALEFAGYP